MPEAGILTFKEAKLEEFDLFTHEYIKGLLSLNISKTCT